MTTDVEQLRFFVSFKSPLFGDEMSLLKMIVVRDGRRVSRVEVIYDDALFAVTDLRCVEEREFPDSSSARSYMSRVRLMEEL